ncbi:MAG: methyltransferase domain-containing protein [Longimicrobiales bacterium]
MQTAQPALAMAAPAISSPPCLVCGRDTVEPFLDLGSTALANRFLTEQELAGPERRYPLVVGYCLACSHVQLTGRVPPDDMFTEYLYVSSASETLKTHFADLSRLLIDRFALGSRDLVIDIGCNDGTLLHSFASRGVRTLGVDPAANLAQLAGPAGGQRLTAFFGSETADRIVEQWGRAMLVTATNTFPHIPDLFDFLTGLDKVLAPGGAFVVEAHYLVDLLEQLAFDTVYHEHVSYWALWPMMRLFELHGFQVVRAERIPLHHGQLRVTVQRLREGVPDASVARLLAQEHALGIQRRETYELFAERVRRLREQLLDALARLRADGARIAAYGAPAKGSTLLEYLGIGRETLAYIVDRSPLKQGRYTPGSHIPIVPVERLMQDRPDYVLLLAWNFADEVLAQQAAYREAGGRFIIPVPEVRIV